MNLYESAEMYLETIFILEKKNGYVRSIDIADYMGYSKPSVSRAVGLLKNDGYIVSEKNGAISLTEKGSAVAQKIYERHTIITEFLMSIGVDEKTAGEDACKIEHDISDKSFEAIKNFKIK